MTFDNDILLAGFAGLCLLGLFFTFNGFKEETMTATITQKNDGTFDLINGKELLGNYSRARDARRGAKRRGLALAS